MKGAGRTIAIAALAAAAAAAGLWLARGRDGGGDGGIAAGSALPVPSGQSVSYLDTISDPEADGGPVYRFRFLAPAIARDGGSVTAEAAQADMQALCDGFALAHLPQDEPKPAQIVISLSDRPVAFGKTDPAATQFFEAFALQDGRCVWEVF